MPHLQTGFHPKLFAAWRQGYGLAELKADAVAALTVAIVALPLSMAIAIASHVGPERGLYTAIIGGFLISALGGSRFQIGGPAGAFIVLVAGIVDAHGLDGLLVATLMAGVIIFLVGALRLGKLIRYVPNMVTLGFTAGIALIIFASQIKELFGLALPGLEPGAILPKIAALWQVRESFNPYAFSVAALTIIVTMGVQIYRRNWPAMLIAVVAASLFALMFAGHAQTVASRFGGIPRGLPAPHLPALGMGQVLQLLPSALSLALLGGVESLLSALVADGMSGRFHRSNTELMAQGIANVVSALFGGIVATGTIARTATNIRAGAKTPVSGMLHSLFLLLFMLVAAPLAGFVPLSALAGVLAVVCWNMAGRKVFWANVKRLNSDSAVLMLTFLLTVFVDLTSGILAGTALAFMVAPGRFLNRPSQFER